MNKSLLKFVFLISAIFTFSNVFATEANMTSAFNTALNTVVGDSSNLQSATIEGYPGWKFLYYDSNDEFSDFGRVQEDQYGYISLTAWSDISVGNQCVGFVKATTNLSGHHTSTWHRGDSIGPYNLPSRGDVIAAFHGYNIYPQTGEGHVAIVLSATPSYVYVIDQNWFGNALNDVGRVIIHIIRFNGEGDNTDASTYSKVEL